MNRQQWIRDQISVREHALERAENSPALTTALTNEIQQLRDMLPNAQNRPQEASEPKDGQIGEGDAETPGESNVASLAGN